MTTPVHILCVTYRRFDLLSRMIASCEAGSRVPDQYRLYSNGGDIGHAVRSGSVIAPADRTVPQNLGRCSVAQAWNTGFRELSGHVIVTGDDVTFGKDTIAGIVRAAERSEALFLYPRVMEAQMFCVYLAKRQLFDRIGWFDERFFPAYFEDNDFCRRMRLAGIEPEPIDDCEGYLHDVSSTLKSFNPPEREEHDTQFRENERRYRDKWGGLPGQELYTSPRA